MSEKEVKTNKNISSTTKKWGALTVVLLILLAASVLTGGFGSTGMVTGSIGSLDGTVTPEQVGEKVVDYINNNILRGLGEATLISTSNTDYGVYNVKFSIAEMEYDSYVTKDGKFLFPQAIDMNEVVEDAEEEQEPAPTTFDAPDTEKPNVKFFVMSFCPYGQQAESGLEPVFQLLGDKIELEPHYVIYSNYGSGYPNYCLDEENKYCSMHGIQELNEGIRQLCISKYYDDSTWWEYVMEINKKCSPSNVDTCWEDVAKEMEIDIDEIKTCQKDEATTLLEIELALNQDYGVRGSPTIYINEEQYNGGRSPEAFKQGICSGFTTEPSECEQALTSGTAASTGTC